jgi:hypothetical protein
VGSGVQWQLPLPLLLAGVYVARSSERKPLVKEARRTEEDGLYSSKGHYAAADWWRSVHLWIGVPTAILTGLAGAAIIGGPSEIWSIPVDLIFGLVAIAGAVSTAVMTFLGPEKRSNSHQTAADRYNVLKGHARRFYEIDVHRSFSDDELADRLEALVKERDDLNQSSPLIPERAYEKAKKGIEAGQAAYQADQ